jgi:hypothetical protein
MHSGWIKVDLMLEFSLTGELMVRETLVVFFFILQGKQNQTLSSKEKTRGNLDRKVSLYTFKCSTYNPYFSLDLNNNFSAFSLPPLTNY